MQPGQVAPRLRSWTGLAVDLLVICCACSCSRGGKPMGVECGGGLFCKDSDCDTLCDAEEGAPTRDSDGDGTPDYLDFDSDGDGLPDMEEAGDEDLRTAAFDRDLNGMSDYLDPRYPLQAGQGRKVPPLDSATESRTDATSRQPSCPEPVADGCEADEASGCNALDDDCDGNVDEGQDCRCLRGEVRRCFAGPPGRRGVGACADGQQVCTGEEVGQWGSCERARHPEPEICDGLDNDCNGCRDDRSDCASKLICPTSNDPRTPDAQPFVPYALDAANFYAGTNVVAYNWYVAGSPCDRLYSAIDPSAHAASGKLSYSLAHADERRAEALFSLSGSYEVVLRILTAHDELFCSFSVHVRAPGVRVELCWDKTGPIAAAQGNAVDLDLHLAKQGETEAFFTPEDCYWDTCSGDVTPWNYADTAPIERCSGPSAQHYATFSKNGSCPNPRLEADNRLVGMSESAYVTENISLDEPADGDAFRVMVHYSANVSADSRSDGGVRENAIETHPIVNVYCDGELRGSFGGVPEQLGDREEVGLSYPGQMWRVADIVRRDGTCSVTPLSPPELGFGYWVSELDASYGD